MSYHLLSPNGSIKSWKSLSFHSFLSVISRMKEIILFGMTEETDILFFTDLTHMTHTLIYISCGGCFQMSLQPKKPLYPRNKDKKLKYSSVQNLSLIEDQKLFGNFCAISYLIVSQRRVVFEGESSFNESGQCFGAPLSHSGVRVLTDLQDTDHR